MTPSWPLIAVTLDRDEEIPDGVFGVLTLHPAPGAGYPPYIFQTMEDDWRDNAKGRSCIPAGDYVLRRSIFYKHNIEAFEVVGVPGRDRILIHVANTEEDVEGCIGLGLHRGPVRVVRDEDTGAANVVKQGVTSSRVALNQFMELMAGVDEIPFTVSWRPGLPLPKPAA